MQAGAVKPLRVFWSYSHRDEALRDELHEHLAGLRRAGLIDDWHDRKIDAGTVWKAEIDRHLGDADIVLLLISASFIASEYCWGDEMTKALAPPHPGPLPPGEGEHAPIQPSPISGEGGARDSGRVRASPKDGVYIGVSAYRLRIDPVSCSVDLGFRVAGLGTGIFTTLPLGPGVAPGR